MWIFSKIGFFSIVQGVPISLNVHVIRARSKLHLDKLLELLERAGIKVLGTAHTTDRDYDWRAMVLSSDVPKILALLGRGINYSNYKGEAQRTLGTQDSEFIELLHGVWSLHFEYQIQKTKTDNRKPKTKTKRKKKP